jgi:TP901 family phage tail tape measure protein
MKKLEKNMYNASNGNKSAAAAFAKLGVSVTDANGKLRDNDAVFGDVIDALGKIDNETERDAVAMSVLGKSAKDLTPLIVAGKDEINALTAEAHDMGYVLGDEALDGLNKLQDTLDTTDKVVEGVKNQFGSMLAPILTGFLKPLLGEFAKLPEAFKTGGVQGVLAVF